MQALRLTRPAVSWHLAGAVLNPAATSV